ncbi:MAG: LacI family DNA-binding transcriptional regulator [Armatimonadetes bacterium]|nr:LacI family DNA-binding transcriptional regulator [Armatimonadota bacterium]
MAVTLKDVAREAGVAVSTVSRVLGGSPHPMTSVATRERVIEAAHRLKYRYNLHARRLRTGRSEVVGIMAWALTWGISFTKLHAVERAVRSKGYRTLVRYAVEAEDALVQFAHEFAESAVEGAILLNFGPDHREALAMLVEREIPIVSLEPLEGVKADVVTVDRVSGVYMVTKHLLELGHRRIGMLHGGFEAPRDKERHQGYRQALAEHGCPVDERDLVLLEGAGVMVSYLRGYHAARELLTRRPLPTALFCSNDEAAIGAMKALEEAGLRIPEEMAVVGFDDVDVAAYAPVPLTTVAQPVAEQAAQAVALLFERIANPEQERPPALVRLKPRLVVRASSGGPVAPETVGRATAPRAPRCG